MQGQVSLRLVAAAAAIGLVAGGSLVTAAPAFAAPGDATAVGLGVDVDAGALAVIGGSVDAELGRVTVVGAGADDDSLLAASITGTGLVSASADVLTTAAASTGTGSTASASAEGVSVTLLGLADAIAVDTATAEVTCPVGAAPASTTDFAGLTVLGAQLDVTDLGVTTSVGLGGALTGLTLSITVDEESTTTATGGTATALIADIEVTGSTLVLPLVDVSGVVTIASASCERPLVALTAVSLTPTEGPTSGGQTVTVTGTGFGPDTTISVDGTAGTNVSVDPTGQSVTFVTPVGDVGPATVVVGSGGSSATLAYTYLAPIVSGLTPSQGPESGGTTVTITGTGLADTDTAAFGGTAATVVSATDTEVVVTSPAGTGTVPVTLTSSTGVVSAAGPFEYLPPTILGLSPTGGPEQGGTTVTITGTDLDDTDDVTFGGVPAVVVSVSPTQVVVISPAGTGSVPVVIELLAGGTVTSPQPFQYIADDDRVVTGLDPRQGPVAGGQQVTISGDGLDDIASVSFAGNAATVVGVTPAGDAVTVTTPPGLVGFAEVVLSFSDGDQIDAGDYLYVGPGSASVDTITPPSGSTAGGTTIVIVGDNLGNVTEVTFGGAPGTIVGTPTDTSITVVTPAGPAGVADVVLLTPDGSALIEDGFTYVAPVTSPAGGSGVLGGLASAGLDTPVLPLGIGAILALLVGAWLMVRRRHA